ncbi:MAG: DUF366 family protein [bacterium]|nr:DUF366 family protein [bacterium]
MKTLFVQEKIKYTGKELRSHFAYDRFSLQGDSLLSFCGECEVTVDDLVDITDIKNNAPIYSENMLHFIAEFFCGDLERAILKQRLLMAIIKDEISSLSGAKLVREGDDIYEGKAKLSVSIATSSPVSFMIHAGVNISSKNTPVETRGLYDYGIEESQFAARILDMFASEMAGARSARCKVRGVK